MPSRRAARSSDEDVSSISPTAFGRLLALHDIEVAAAIAMAADGGYSDFFVEGSGPPWHEAFGDAGVASLPEEGTAARMAFVDMIRAETSDGYSDFFVEGSGPPWHEAFGDSAVASLPAVAAVSEAARAGALLQLNVFQAYQRLKEQATFRQ
jgi:hypothetical protein